MNFKKAKIITKETVNRLSKKGLKNNTTRQVDVDCSSDCACDAYDK